jgi:hypothetical protein
MKYRAYTVKTILLIEKSWKIVVEIIKKYNSIDMLVML